ncbi:MAG: serine hydrolase [Saprospiraceae bacterium]
MTLRDMMQMSSGLNGWKITEVFPMCNRCFYMEQDIFSFLKNKKAEFESGTQWKYSSGTTNLLMGLIRQTLGDDKS